MSYKEFPVRLVDVSRYQDKPDTVYKPTFEKIAAEGFLGAGIRVGYGLVTDGCFRWFWEHAKGQLQRKPYWFLDTYSQVGISTTDEEWGRMQAGKCYDLLEADFGEIPLALDCESSKYHQVSILTKGRFNRVAKAFHDEWFKVTGKHCEIYCSPNFVQFLDSWAKGLKLWLAWYSRWLTIDYIQSTLKAKGWTGQIMMWQYASNGDMNDDGIADGLTLGMETSALDLNVFLGTLQEWSAYCGETAVPEPPPVVVPPIIPTGKTFTVFPADGLNVRDVPIGMAGSQVIGWNPKGKVLTALETVAIGQDIWIRITPWSVCAVRYNEIVYLL